jgi:Peptidase A4 family
MSNQEVLTDPHGQGAIDSDTRLKLTEAMLKNIRPTSSAPEAFDAFQAANKDLLNHGLPSRPNPFEKPAQYAKWSRFTSKHTQYIPPTFKIITDDSTRTPVKSVGATGGASANSTSGNWSGAVTLPPAAGESYNSCSARWVVPNAWPPLSAWTGSGWKDGSWEEVAWVGIDGWSAQTAILQAGTKSVVTVKSGKVQQSTWAWYEWWPAYEIAYSNFQVQPGDTVEVLVCSFSPTTGYAGITNVGANTSTSVNLSAPMPTAVLKGENAEWILEDDSIGGAEAPFADYGAIFFYDCNASTQKREVNLTDAILVNMVEGGVTVSTPVEVSPTVLEIYEGNAGP